MCGQLTAYNTYATLPYTNPLFIGFSCSQNVNKEIIFALAMCHVAVALKFCGVMIFQKVRPEICDLIRKNPI